MRMSKDPGVALFTGFKSELKGLEIDYSNLSKFDYSSVPVWMEQEGKEVLARAERDLA